MIFIQPFPSLPPSPLNRTPSCMSTLSPNSVDRGNEKGSTTGAHIFSFPPTLEKREKEVRRCGWCTLLILDKVQTNRKKKKKNKNIYIYMDKQKIFNGRGLIIYFRVKKKGIFFQGHYPKKLCYRLQNPEKIIQKS